MSESTFNTPNTPNHTPHTSDAPPIAASGCLLRLIWSIGGSGAIYLSLATLAATSPPPPSALDFVVGITLILMLVARWLDIAKCNGSTLSGEPANLGHWRRYAVLLVGSTLAAWWLAHWVAGSFSQ